MDPQDHQLSDALKRELEQQADDLDMVTRAKLAAARHRATDAVSTHNSRLPMRPWTLGAGLASIALLVMILLPTISAPPVIQPDETHLTATTMVLEDLSILTASDSVEFYQSVDFLLWLESNSGSEG